VERKMDCLLTAENFNEETWKRSSSNAVYDLKKNLLSTTRIYILKVVSIKFTLIKAPRLQTVTSFTAQIVVGCNQLQIL
jgi:hypothetical protein